MSDIWSNLGTNISGPGGGGWLYHKGGEMHGPVSMEVLVDKLARGEINLKTPVAKEGGDFNPIGKVAAFAPHLEAVKAKAKKISAAKRRKLLVFVGLPVIAGLSVGGYFLKGVYDKHESEKAEKQASLEAEQKKKQEELDKALKSGKPKLVALVSLGDVSDMKVGGTRRGGGKSGGGGGGGGKEPDEMVAGCQRSQNEIYGVLGRHIAKINVCVQDERSRDSGGQLPSTLELQFAISTSGKIAEFEVGHRHYRSGPMKNCMVKAFKSIRYPSAGGSNCAVTIPIKIGG